MNARKHNARAHNKSCPALYFKKLTTLVRNWPLPSHPQWRGGACTTRAADEGVPWMPSSSFVLPNPQPAQNMQETTTPPWTRIRVDRRASALVERGLRGCHCSTRLSPSYNLVVFYFWGGCVKVVDDVAYITWSQRYLNHSLCAHNNNSRHWLIIID